MVYVTLELASNLVQQVRTRDLSERLRLIWGNRSEPLHQREMAKTGIPRELRECHHCANSDVSVEIVIRSNLQLC